MTDSALPNECPKCGSQIEPPAHQGALGTGGFVGAEGSSGEPFMEMIACPNCGTELTRHRDSGEGWVERFS